MSQPEGTVDLMKAISKGYDTAINSCTTLLLRYQDPESPRDVCNVLSILKKTLKRMKRANPEWTTLHHGAFYLDDDEMGNIRIMLITDVAGMVTGESAPHSVFMIENIEVDAEAPILVGDGSDYFLDKVELYGPDICRDMFIAMNYIGHAETSNYKTVSADHQTCWG
jgi:hypothetical protein